VGWFVSTNFSLGKLIYNVLNPALLREYGPHSSEEGRAGKLAASGRWTRAVNFESVAAVLEVLKKLHVGWREEEQVRGGQWSRRGAGGAVVVTL